MDLNELSEEIEKLEQICSNYLVAPNLSDEEIAQLNKEPSLHQINAFNAKIAECKKELKNSSLEKMKSALKLLFDLEIDEFNADVMSKYIRTFANIQLDSGLFLITEKHLLKMQHTLDNIDAIYQYLLTRQSIIDTKQKDYVFKYGSKEEKLLSLNLAKLENLRDNIRFQAEFNAKAIADKIIDDFHDIYIFFLFSIYITIAQKEELLSIEIANEIDRFIKVISYVFNERTLKNQDMLYYYATYELNELKHLIYSHISQYNTDL